MTLPLTPEMLRAAYDYLRASPPFIRWNMPDPDEIKFRVSRHKDRFGHCRWLGDRWEIVISSHFVGRTDVLIGTMAHELVHLHMGETGMDRRCSEHGEAFAKLARQVCKYHGWDAKTF